MGKFSNSYYASDIGLKSLKFSIKAVPVGQIEFLTENIILHVV